MLFDKAVVGTEHGRAKQEAFCGKHEAMKTSHQSQRPHCTQQPWCRNDQKNP